MHLKYIFHNNFRMILFHDQETLSLNFESSCLQMFFKIIVLKMFAIFTGKLLCWSYLLINLQAWRTAIALKRHSNTGVFCEYCRISKNKYFEEHLQVAASVLLIIKLTANLFLIKNTMWNSFYLEVLLIWSEYIFTDY